MEERSQDRSDQERLQDQLPDWLQIRLQERRKVEENRLQDQSQTDWVQNRLHEGVPSNRLPNRLQEGLPSDRLQDRLQASLAGLEELRMLKERQEERVRAMITSSSRRRMSVDASFLHLLNRYPDFNQTVDRSEQEPMLDHSTDESFIAPSDPQKMKENADAKVKEWLRLSHCANPPHSDVNPRERRHSYDVTNSRRSYIDSTKHDNYDVSKLSVNDVELDIERVTDDVTDEPRDEVDAASDKDSSLELAVQELSGYSKLSPYRHLTVQGNRNKDAKGESKLGMQADSNQRVHDDINSALGVQEDGKLSVHGGIGHQALAASIQRRRSFSSASPSRPQQRRNSVSIGALPDHQSFTRPCKLQGSRTVFSYPSPLHAVILHTQTATALDEGEGAETDQQTNDHLAEILRQPNVTYSRPTRQDYSCLRQISEESDVTVKNEGHNNTIRLERDLNDSSDDRCKRTNKRFSLRSDTADSGFAGSCMSLATNSSTSSYSRRYNPAAWSFSSTDSDPALTDMSRRGIDEGYDEDEGKRSIETIPEMAEMIESPPVPPPRRRTKELNRPRSVATAYELKSIAPSSETLNVVPPVPPPRMKLENRRRTSDNQSRQTRDNMYGSNSGTIV